MTQENLIVSRKMDVRRIRKSLQWIGIILVMIALTACGGGAGGSSDEDGSTPNTSSNADPSSNNGGTVASTPTIPSAPPPPPPVPPPAPAPTMPEASDQQLFASTVHPIMVSNNCVQCHSDPTPLGLTPILPLMADETVETAYNAVVNNQKVSLTNPGNSRLVLKTRVDNHNCGGAVACEQFATEMEAAIRSWADSVAAANPPPNNLPRVASAMASLADGQDGGNARADANLLAMYDFSAGSGDIVVDRSGVGVPMDLMIEGMEWVPEGGLRNVSGKAQASLAASQKLINSISTQFSVEAWVIPENLDQTGPARIVSYSINTGGRNFTMGQSGDRFNDRVSTNGTGRNGNNPELRSDNDTVTTELTHVVMTFDSAADGRKIYINGELAAEETLANSALNWSNNDIFLIGNEVTNDRLWKGVFRMVAVHNSALSGSQIAQNFDAGLGTITTLAFDVSNIVGATASIQMQVRELDDKAYVFAVPTLVTDAAGVPVKNIRVAVNNSIPVATQAFRSVDMMVTQSGTELSPLGAVIPKDLGPDMDMFHLEFETLGTQVGSGDIYVPPSEPGIVNLGVLPDIGVRPFSSVNDTMSALTTIPVTQNTVRNRYEELRDQLPATADILAFNAASQIAIQRLAVTYCDRVRRSNAACNVVFDNSCNDIANAADKQNRVNALFDRFVGDLENQPDRAETTAEVNRLMDDLGCANGCTNATKDIALQASCAAVLSSGVMTIN